MAAVSARNSVGRAVLTPGTGCGRGGDELAFRRARVAALSAKAGPECSLSDVESTLARRPRSPVVSTRPVHQRPQRMAHAAPLSANSPCTTNLPTVASLTATDEFVAQLWIEPADAPIRCFVRVEVRDGGTVLAMADSTPFASLPQPD
jgi:hypothetical protein